MQHVTKVNTTIQSLRIGYDNNNDVVADESIMITSDFNFVDVDFYLEYRVSDPVKAVYASKDPDIILQNIAQSCIRARIQSLRQQKSWRHLRQLRRQSREKKQA